MRYIRVIKGEVYLMIEICVDSVQSAIRAYEGGADRLEVCSNLVISGTTPPIALIRGIKKHVDLPLNILIRPRHGDFCYSDYEVEDMKEYIRMIKDESVNGVVIGILKADGTVDMERMEELVKLAKPMYITFHRAFDMVRDPVVAMNRIVNLQIDCILTSGQKNSAYEGRELIKTLVERSKGKIEIMPGGGITVKNYRQIIDTCHVNYIHLSAKQEVMSKMNYRNEAVNMGQTSVDEFTYFETNKDIISVIKALDK